MSHDAPPGVHPHHVVVASRRRRLATCAFHAGDWAANPISGLAGTDRIDGLCIPHTAHVRACTACGGPTLAAVRTTT
ncbi:hypothetical protein [Parafrankia discariae]|uniref:hypothetical protein n=1 Tax=Parafrankia discariae TaxID=365528 RepID=UPI00035D6C74|nr:hypothetical protein [Parafrankia discariae]